MADVAVAQAKSILQSKTVWLNVLGILIMIVNELAGKMIPTEYAALALAILNIIVRFLTKQPLTLAMSSSAPAAAQPAAPAQEPAEAPTQDPPTTPAG